MNVAGIIAEYNPFHNGHLYHLQKTKQLSGADYLIVVLSGNFVQRGEPAIFDKSVRTRMALLCGADLVLELPAPFACGSAEDFAMGAVSLLHHLGVTTHLSFGSEDGEQTTPKKAAQIALAEPPAYREALKNALSRGLTYPQARSIALCTAGLNEEEAALIEKPNNLLGMEYCKALYALKSPILPVTVERKGCGYHDQELKTEKFASASALRKALAELMELSEKHARFSEEFSETHARLSEEFSETHTWLSEEFSETHIRLSEQLPPVLRSFYRPELCFPLYPDDFSSMLNYQILLSRGRFSDFSDCSPELANRLEKQALSPLSFTERITSLKTRQYTYTRISRTLIHLLLMIHREEMETYRDNGYSIYARILGFNQKAAPLLRLIKKHTAIPLLSKAADAEKILPEKAKKLWQKDIFCSQVYAAGFQQKYKKTPPDEFRRQIIIQ